MARKILFPIVLLSLFLVFVGVSFSAYSQTNKLSDGGVAMFTLDEPITIMSASSDSKGASYDNRYLGYFTILQVKPDLYYMYYECSGTNHYVFNHIAFAYSTDGLNWIRSFPAGISHTVYDEYGRTIKNSNLISYKDIREFDVVKVQDPEYPFRMIANEWINQDKYRNDTQLCMWKSKDGVNFEDKVVLLASKHDTQPSVIVRGNVLKIYIRLRGKDDLRKRHVGYMYVDTDGVMIAPPTLLSEDLYYTSGASILDNNREILFPTYFNQKYPEHNHYESCIVENNHMNKIEADMSVLNKEGDKWGMISPHIITINHAQYIAYHQANFDHSGNTDERIKRTEFRLSKITFNTEGLPCTADLRK